MGYGVPQHLEALSRLGPTLHHRRSFAPVAAHYAQTTPVDDAIALPIAV
jgi:ribonuclease HII